MLLDTTFLKSVQRCGQLRISIPAALSIVDVERPDLTVAFIRSTTRAWRNTGILIDRLSCQE